MATQKITAVPAPTQYRCVLVVFPVGGNVLDPIEAKGGHCYGFTETDALHDALVQIAKKMGYSLKREVAQ